MKEEHRGVEEEKEEHEGVEEEKEEHEGVVKKKIGEWSRGGKRNIIRVYIKNRE